MKIAVVYGTDRKGCTYQIAQEVIKNIPDAQVEEIFLPRDFSLNCKSCFQCFTGEYGRCLHKEYKEPLLHKMEEADLIILTSPVYAFHLTGQMKSFLDHFSYMWMVHRPNPKMFRKQGLVISTASGPVTEPTLKELKDSLDFWGIARTYKFGTSIYHTNWVDVTEKKKAKVRKKARKLAKKIEKNKNRVKPCLRVKKWFYFSLNMQKKGTVNPVDAQYWKEQGWLDGRRPWAA